MKGIKKAWRKYIIKHDTGVDFTWTNGDGRMGYILLNLFSQSRMREMEMRICSNKAQRNRQGRLLKSQDSHYKNWGRRLK